MQRLFFCLTDMTRKSHLDLFFAALCASFVLSAMYLNTYGAVAPLTMEAYGIDAASQGFLVTMQSIGGTAIGIYLGLRGEAHNKLIVIAAGLLALACGTVFMGLAPPYILLTLLTALSGVGFTCIDIMVNGAVADMFDEDRDTRLSIVHAFYNTGAMCAPLLAAALVHEDNTASWPLPFLVIGIGCAVLLLAYLAGMKKVMKYSPYAHMEEQEGKTGRDAFGVYRFRHAWILFGAGILYFSFQMGTTAWLPSYCVERGITLTDANFLLTAFFAGSLVMSFACALFLKRISAAHMFGFFGLASAACLFAGLLSPVNSLLAVLVTASGFCQGCGVVTLIIVATDAFPSQSASAASIQVLSANVGAVTAPLWMGALADIFSYQLPLLVGCGLYAAGAGIVLRFVQRRPTAEKTV